MWLHSAFAPEWNKPVCCRSWVLLCVLIWLPKPPADSSATSFSPPALWYLTRWDQQLQIYCSSIFRPTPNIHLHHHHHLHHHRVSEWWTSRIWLQADYKTAQFNEEREWYYTVFINNSSLSNKGWQIAQTNNFQKIHNQSVFSNQIKIFPWLY